MEMFKWQYVEWAYRGTSCIMENVESFVLRVGPRINRSNVFRWDTLAYAQAGEGEEDENKVIHRQQRRYFSAIQF
jgi:hypothetical protein